MRPPFARSILIAGLATSLIAGLTTCLIISSASADSIALGKVEFLVDTNVKMFRFKGEADQLQSKLTREGSQLKHVELTIPVDSLKTGMSLRDHHMRERVFTAADGKTPDVVFDADVPQCSSHCEITGNLTIRGQTRPQLIDLTLKDPTHVEGTAKVALSKFGITDPSQAGVTVDDVVNVDFSVELK